KQTSYARVLSGEIPILFDYDFNASRGKYKAKANIAFVIPAEGTVIVPSVIGLVRKGPDPDHARTVLDHLVSDAGHALPAPARLAHRRRADPAGWDRQLCGGADACAELPQPRLDAGARRCSHRSDARDLGHRRPVPLAQPFSGPHLSRRDAHLPARLS